MRSFSLVVLVLRAAGIKGRDAETNAFYTFPGAAVGGMSESDVTLTFLLSLCVGPLQSRPGRRGAGWERSGGAGTWLLNLAVGICAGKTWLISASP